MQKKLIALAMAAAFAAPAFAATSNVDISGTLDMSLDSVKGKTGREKGVSSNASNVILKGAEDLGGGLSAVWQVQTFINFGGTGANTANDGTLSNGVSFIGLKSESFGMIAAGKFDSSMKSLGRKVDLFNNHLGDSRNLIQKAAVYDAPAYVTVGDWDARPMNTVLYASPSFAGFDIAAHYTTNADAKVADGTQTTVAGVGVNYANGPFFVGAAYQKNYDHRPASMFPAAAEDPAALRIAGGFTMGDFKLVGLWEKTKDNTGEANTSDDRTVWGLGGAYNMGNLTLKTQYYKAGKIGDLANSGANMWALGADYNLSKRTAAYFGYAQTSNDSNAAYSVSAGGHDDNYSALHDQTTSGFQIGMKHTF